MSRNNCMYMVPHELSGMGNVCDLLQNACNGLGTRCLAYRPHNAETRKALADAIAAKKAQKHAAAKEDA